MDADGADIAREREKSFPKPFLSPPEMDAAIPYRVHGQDHTSQACGTSVGTSQDGYQVEVLRSQTQSDFRSSDVTILHQPLRGRRAAVVVHRGTFTSNARKMLLRPILENGTIRTAIKNCPRNQSVWLLTSGLVTYLYMVSYLS